MNSFFKTMDQKQYSTPEVEICLIQTEATIAQSDTYTTSESEGFQEEDWD